MPAVAGLVAVALRAPGRTVAARTRADAEEFADDPEADENDEPDQAGDEERQAPATEPVPPAFITE